MTISPCAYSESTKKGQIEKMFDNISGRYDLLNHLLSLNIDKLWRKRAVSYLKKYNPETILDIATGTADFAIAATRVKPRKITGIDLSERMLEIGRKKIEKLGLSGPVTLTKGDSEQLSFKDNSFDCAIVGFGVRNFEDLRQGLSEIFRVLNPGGAFIVLEFSRPHNRLFRELYFFYLAKVLPWFGRIISKDRRAYEYLPESVFEFPDGQDFNNILKDTGFMNCRWITQTFGIATIYIAEKPKVEHTYNK